MTPQMIVIIASAAIQGVEEAIALWPSLKASVLAGQDPTPDQWKQIAVALASSHARLQAA